MLKRPSLFAVLAVGVILLGACSGKAKEAAPASGQAQTNAAKQTAPSDGIRTVKKTEKLKLDLLTYEIHSVSVASEFQQFKTDKQFVIIEMTASNHTATNNTLMPTHFVLKDGTGAEFQAYDMGAWGFAAIIGPEKYKQGHLLFETPKGISKLRLIVRKEGAFDLGL